MRSRFLLSPKKEFQTNEFNITIRVTKFLVLLIIVT